MQQKLSETYTHPELKNSWFDPKKIKKKKEHSQGP